MPPSGRCFVKRVHVTGTTFGIGYVIAKASHEESAFLPLNRQAKSGIGPARSKVAELHITLVSLNAVAE